MAESLLVGRNFVLGICKLKPNKTVLKSNKNLFFGLKKNKVFTSPSRDRHDGAQCGGNIRGSERAEHCWGQPRPETI